MTESKELAVQSWTFDLEEYTTLCNNYNTLVGLCQKPTESIKRFGERVVLQALKIYPKKEIITYSVQRTLMEVFRKGLLDENLKREFKNKPYVTIYNDFGLADQYDIRTCKTIVI